MIEMGSGAVLPVARQCPLLPVTSHEERSDGVRAELEAFLFHPNPEMLEVLAARRPMRHLEWLLNEVRSH